MNVAFCYIDKSVAFKNLFQPFLEMKFLVTL